MARLHWDAVSKRAREFSLVRNVNSILFPRPYFLPGTIVIPIILRFLELKQCEILARVLGHSPQKSPVLLLPS